MIECSDCLKFLAGLEDESVDLVLTDPPYFDIVDEDWDKQWDTLADYLKWCGQWTRECVRVLKPGRCLYVWGTTKTNAFLQYKLTILDSPSCCPELVYQNWIIWSYDWGGRTRKTFPRKHEDLLMYSKGKEFVFNADEVRIPYKMKKNVRAGAQNNPLGKVPTDVWEQNNHTTSKEYCDWHKTQKPVALLQRIIRANTHPGDLVLDIFSGSGSTAIACDREGRKFVGCDQSRDYVERSRLRREALYGSCEASL